MFRRRKERNTVFVLWNVSKQSFPNNALYSSEEEALDYAGRIQAAQALQVHEADELVAVELAANAG
jgi:hypothetical protein